MEKGIFRPNCWSNYLVESLGQITGLNCWVKSGDQVELVEVVLRFRGYLDVVFLDLGDLGTVLVMVAAGVAALWAERFHGVLGVNRRACRIASVAW